MHKAQLTATYKNLLHAPQEKVQIITKIIS